MMNPRIQKVTAEIERVKEKLAAQQQRLRELEQQKTELENTEIVGVVRGLDVTPEELASLLRTPPVLRIGRNRNMKRKFLSLLAACLCAALLVVPAYAQSNETEAAPAESKPEEKASNPFTPKGTGTVVDEATDEDGKEF